MEFNGARRSRSRHPSTGAERGGTLALRLPWWFVRRRLLRMLAAEREAALSVEAFNDPEVERSHLAQAARIGRLIAAGDDAKRSR